MINIYINKFIYIMDINQIIIIQKYYRRYYIKKFILIPSSYYQTKEWRKNQIWYNNGKHNECEKYQINLVEKILLIKLNKTNIRIYIEELKLCNIYNPNVYENGYEYTENFDSYIFINNITYYFNFKFVCDKGGSQTRTLREVYNFIKYQLDYLLKNNINNIYFINILDGDTCYDNMNKLNYIKNKEIYNKFKKYIYIGDLYNFQKSNFLINNK